MHHSIILDLACNSWTTPSQNVALDVDVASRSSTGIVVRRTQQKQLIHEHPKRKTIDLCKCKQIHRILDQSDKNFTKSLKQIYYKDKLNNSNIIVNYYNILLLLFASPYDVSMVFAPVLLHVISVKGTEKQSNAVINLMFFHAIYCNRIK